MAKAAGGGRTLFRRGGLAVSFLPVGFGSDKSQSLVDEIRRDMPESTWRMATNGVRYASVQGIHQGLVVVRSDKRIIGTSLVGGKERYTNASVAGRLYVEISNVAGVGGGGIQAVRAAALMAARAGKGAYLKPISPAVARLYSKLGFKTAKDEFTNRKVMVMDREAITKRWGANG